VAGRRRRPRDHIGRRVGELQVADRQILAHPVSDGIGTDGLPAIGEWRLGEHASASTPTAPGTRGFQILRTFGRARRRAIRVPERPYRRREDSRCKCGCEQQHHRNHRQLGPGHFFLPPHSAAPGLPWSGTCRLLQIRSSARSLSPSTPPGGTSTSAPLRTGRRECPPPRSDTNIRCPRHGGGCNHASPQFRCSPGRAFHAGSTHRRDPVCSARVRRGCGG
jgi:hypothetical protein